MLEEKHNIMGGGKTTCAPVIEVAFNSEGANYTFSFFVLDMSEAVSHMQEETGVQIHGLLSTQFFCGT